MRNLVTEMHNFKIKSVFSTDLTSGNGGGDVVVDDDDDDDLL
jgi:hypothetical protein